MKDWNYITEEATDTKRLNNRETAQFHYFNPNGLTAKQNEINNKMFDLVDNGKCKSGALMVYNHNYGLDQLQKLAQMKRVNRTSLIVDIKMAQDHIDKALAFIDQCNFIAERAA